jgi:hypothetical protein
MAKNNKDKILTRTNYKVIIRVGEIGKALNDEETRLFHNLIDKLNNYDRRR